MKYPLEHLEYSNSMTTVHSVADKKLNGVKYVELSEKGGGD